MKNRIIIILLVISIALSIFNMVQIQQVKENVGIITPRMDSYFDTLSTKQRWIESDIGTVIGILKPVQKKTIY